VPRIAVIKFLFLALSLCAAVYFFCFTEAGRDLTPASVIDAIRSQNPLVQRLSYMLIYMGGTILLLPGTILSFAGAVLFGAYEGTVYTWLAATMGAALAFWLARFLGRDFIGRLTGKLDALDRYIREHGFTGLFIIRLIPLFPFNGVNFACGLTGMRFRDYALATALGILPGTFVYQYLFAKFHEKVLKEGVRLEYLADPELLLAIGIFVAFVVVGQWAARKWRGRAKLHCKSNVDLHK
jgi:uncharacterized membrane protein YdjX (TVP38/TMEM64 family)